MHAKIQTRSACTGSMEIGFRTTTPLRPVRFVSMIRGRLLPRSAVRVRLHSWAISSPTHPHGHGGSACDTTRPSTTLIPQRLILLTCGTLANRRRWGSSQISAFSREQPDTPPLLPKAHTFLTTMIAPSDSGPFVRCALPHVRTTVRPTHPLRRQRPPRRQRHSSRTASFRTAAAERQAG